MNIVQMNAHIHHNKAPIHYKKRKTKETQWRNLCFPRWWWVGWNPSMNADCYQNKGCQKDGKKIWLSQHEQAACDPLSAGWLVLKQQDLVERPTVTPGWPVSLPAGRPAQARPSFLILVTCMGSVGMGWKGGCCMVWHTLDTARWNGSPPNRCGLNHSPLLQCIALQIMTLCAHQCKALWEKRQSRRKRRRQCCVCLGSGVTTRLYEGPLLNNVPNSACYRVFYVMEISLQAISVSQTQHIICNPSGASPSPPGQKTSQPALQWQQLDIACRHVTGSRCSANPDIYLSGFTTICWVSHALRNDEDIFLLLSVPSWWADCNIAIQIKIERLS